VFSLNGDTTFEPKGIKKNVKIKKFYYDVIK